MSIEDYIKVEESLFADTEEEMDREYYENEVSEVDIPNPEEASKKFIEKYGEEGVVEDYEEIEDDEEKAYESFSPVKMNNKKNMEGPIVIDNIVKENAETDDMFNTRKILYDRILSLGVYSVEECDVYSRVITNKLWYSVSYNDKVEKVVKRIFKLMT